jgi:hypothetical protein
MSSLVLSGDTSGTITVAVPAVAGSNTATLPAATGTVMVSGNMPAFSAYLSANQNITSTVITKVTLDTEEYDTAGCFNNTGSTVTLNGLSVPSYSFCPNVAGYYQVSAQLRYAVSGGAIGSAFANFVKNGSPIYRFNELTAGSYTSGLSVIGSALIYLNGTGDYISIEGLIGGTSPFFQTAGTPYTGRLQAVMVRGA